MADATNPSSQQQDRFTPIGVLSFPHLFKARSVVEGADPRFSLNLIFDKNAQATPEFKQLKSEIVACARAKWPGKADEMLKNGQLRLPIRRATEKKQFGGYEDPDGVFINAWSKQLPTVVDASGKNKMMESDVFPGCTGRISYNCFSYEQSGNRGIGIGLSHVQIREHDENKRLDNRKSGLNTFDALDVSDLDFKPGAGEADDEIPF
jgi:hypothetical protein